MSIWKKNWHPHELKPKSLQYKETLTSLEWIQSLVEKSNITKTEFNYLIQKGEYQMAIPNSNSTHVPLDISTFKMLNVHYMILNHLQIKIPIETRRY